MHNKFNLSIGATVWCGHEGRVKPVTITGETSRSWLLGHRADAVKIPKSVADEVFTVTGFRTTLYFLTKEVAQAWKIRWMRHDVVARVRDASPDELLKVADVLGLRVRLEE